MLGVSGGAGGAHREGKWVLCEAKQLEPATSPTC